MICFVHVMMRLITVMLSIKTVSISLKRLHSNVHYPASNTLAAAALALIRSPLQPRRAISV